METQTEENMASEMETGASKSARGRTLEGRAL